VRLTPLALACSALFGVNHSATAGTVTDCTDGGGAGTLRSVVAAAAEAEIIDLTACAGSTITLASGQIVFTKPDFFVINYNAASHAIISGNHNGRVFKHTGTGGFTVVRNVDIKYGESTGANVAGGCIYSTAEFVKLDHATLYKCQAISSSGTARGGGLFSTHAAYLVDSTVSGNDAVQQSSTHYLARGGGIYADTLYAYNSTISNNKARFSTAGSAVNKYTEGGGAFIVHTARVLSSTISGNYAGIDAGALLDASATGSVLVVNSTISNNYAGRKNAGIAVPSAALTLANSTVAFNTVFQANGAGGVYAGGTVKLLSSIIANNKISAGSIEADLVIGLAAGQVDPATANNLVMQSNQVLPADTITLDPRLLPLADNGGKSRTHALKPSSPALDRGNRLLLVNGSMFSCDQRGNPTAAESIPPHTDHCDATGGFLRVDSDPKHSKPDIGAYEEQLPNPDWIFYDGFGF